MTRRSQLEKAARAAAEAITAFHPDASNPLERPLSKAALGLWSALDGKTTTTTIKRGRRGRRRTTTLNG